MASREYRIVGQGLAGTVLAYMLLQQGAKVTIWNTKNRHSASSVAAGMWNPLNFRRYTFSWRAPELVPFAVEFYQKLEKQLGIPFAYNKSLYRRIPDANSRNVVLKNIAQLRDFASLKECGPEPFEKDHFPYGVLQVHQAGVLDLNTFLLAAENDFRARGILQEEAFSWAEATDFDGITISCEGVGMQQNPYFSWLPLVANKGQILSLRAPLPDTNAIFNCGKFLFLSPQGTWRAGATYENHYEDLQPTEKGVASIAEPIEKALGKPLEVTDVISGLRPTVVDRRPMLGIHPKYKNIAVFNGLGTKGVMLAPFFAQQMATFLNQNGVLDIEVDIQRFIKKYYNS